jgi:hypothetical protein
MNSTVLTSCTRLSEPVIHRQRIVEANDQPNRMKRGVESRDGEI